MKLFEKYFNLSPKQVEKELEKEILIIGLDNKFGHEIAVLYHENAKKAALATCALCFYLQHQNHHQRLIYICFKTLKELSVKIKSKYAYELDKLHECEGWFSYDYQEYSSRKEISLPKFCEDTDSDSLLVFILIILHFTIKEDDTTHSPNTRIIGSVMTGRLYLEIINTFKKINNERVKKDGYKNKTKRINNKRNKNATTKNV
jgi:hypothetical protein